MRAEMSRSKFPTLTQLFNYAFKKLEEIFNCNINGSTPNSLVRMSVLLEQPECLITKLPGNLSRLYHSKTLHEDSAFSRLVTMSSNKTGQLRDLLWKQWVVDDPVGVIKFEEFCKYIAVHSSYLSRKKLRKKEMYEIEIVQDAE